MFLWRILLSAFFLISSHKGHFWGLSAWISLIPWLDMLDKSRQNRQAFGWSFSLGMLFYLPSAFWLTHVTYAGYFFLCVFLSFYFAIFGLLYRFFSTLSMWPRILVLSALWTSLEYVRSLGPFGLTWFFLGSSQIHNLPFCQIVSLGGFFATSFVIFWVNGGIHTWLSKRKISPFVAGAILVVILELYGFAKLNKEEVKGPALKIAAIQADVRQDLKWDEEYRAGIYYQYQKLTLEAGRKHPDLIIWPETAIPGDIHQDKELRKWLSFLGQETEASFLVGANNDRWDQEGFVTNAAFLLNEKGKIIDRYDKIHLVPFGEYIPFRTLIPWLGKLTIGDIDFSPGKDFHVFNLKKVRFSVLLCFEDTLPRHVRKFVRKGARLLFNLTNDAWFKDSSAAWEHFNLARLSAIANGVTLVRVTNTGVSGVISSRGETLNIIKDAQNRSVEVEGVFVEKVGESFPRTLYLKVGDLFSDICCTVVILAFFAKMASRVKKTKGGLYAQ